MAERKVIPRSEWAESTRKKQSAWRKENRATLAADMPKESADAFRAWCKSQGKTVSGVLSEYIYSIIGREPDATPPDNTRSAKKTAGADAENQAQNLKDGAGED